MTFKSLVVITALLGLTACTQYTPSMMNSSKVQLSHSTIMEQIAFEDIHDQSLSALAAHYAKNGVSDLDLTMTYDPTCPKFTKMSAEHELKHVRSFLSKKSVKNITSQITAVPKGKPSLIVSYDIVQALAPNDCQLMPGLDGEQTTRFVDEYKFGCSTETMLSVINVENRVQT